MNTSFNTGEEYIFVCMGYWTRIWYVIESTNWSLFHLFPFSSILKCVLLVHIRRGDFKRQYNMQTRTIEELYLASKDILKANSTIFIATDEPDKSFFQPLGDYYDICFLDDFHHLLDDIDSNLFGLIEQMVLSKGDIFIGTYYSTFSAYVFRIRVGGVSCIYVIRSPLLCPHLYFYFCSDFDVCTGIL